MIDIKIKLLNPFAVVPKKANNDEGNACYDVYPVTETHNEEFGFIEYGLGFATEFTEEFVAKIYPRSSISKSDLLLCNHTGIVDSSYRGEWKLRFKKIEDGNPNYRPKIGEAVAQVMIEKVLPTKWVVTDELSNTNRGDKGFGSTNGLI